MKSTRWQTRAKLQTTKCCKHGNDAKIRTHKTNLIGKSRAHKNTQNPKTTASYSITFREEKENIIPYVVFKYLAAIFFVI